MVNLATFDRKDTFEGRFDQSIFSETLTGGRGLFYNFFSQQIAQTGDQIDDIVGGQDYSAFYIDNTAKNFCLRGYFHFQYSSSTNKSEMWLGGMPYGVFPTDTSVHIGFKVIESAGLGDGHANVYATNGNGTAYTETLIFSGLSKYKNIWCGFIYTAGHIYYYMSADDSLPMVLVAVHTTNIPVYIGVTPSFWLKTTEAVLKQTTCWNSRWTLGE
jgi:hypothetical protein